LRDNSNQRVIDMLQDGDVLVADIFGKIEGGPLSAITWPPIFTPSPTAAW